MGIDTPSELVPVHRSMAFRSNQRLLKEGGGSRAAIGTGRSKKLVRVRNPYSWLSGKYRENCFRWCGSFSEVVSTVQTVRETLVSIPRARGSGGRSRRHRTECLGCRVWFASVRRTGRPGSRQIKASEMKKEDKRLIMERQIGLQHFLVSRSYQRVSGSHDVHRRGLVPLMKRVNLIQYGNTLDLLTTAW